jgi:hypothetical protein
VLLEEQPRRNPLSAVEQILDTTRASRQRQNAIRCRP